MDELIKIFTIGNTEVGKTSILKKFIQNEFHDKVVNTQGLDFFIANIMINNRNIKFHLWDTAGQERYKGITTSYFKNAHGILLVFALNSKKTFEQIDQWLKIIKESSKINTKLLLVGNKCDLEEREVEEEEAIEFANKNNMEYYETSAKTGVNIDKIFTRIGELVHNDFPLDDKKQDNSNIKISSHSPEKVNNEEKCSC